jgi:hypothetical protein
MTRLILAALAAALAFSPAAEARHHHRWTSAQPADPLPGPYWTYEKWTPPGAWQTTVTIGPGGKRCTSRLMLSRSGWWVPRIQCEVVARAD